jgi:hypothetical protein
MTGNIKVHEKDKRIFDMLQAELTLKWVFIAYVNRKDEHHTYAVHLVEKILNNEYGAPFTSDMVFDETMTFILFTKQEISVRP